MVEKAFTGNNGKEIRYYPDREIVFIGDLVNAEPYRQIKTGSILIKEHSESKNPQLLFRIQRNQKDLGLEDKTIRIYEDCLLEGKKDGIASYSQKTGSDEYEIHISMYGLDIFKKSALFMPFFLEYIIRHELVRIKNGDCDRNSSHLLARMYEIMIAGPRANIKTFMLMCRDEMYRDDLFAYFLLRINRYLSKKIK